MPSNDLLTAIQALRAKRAKATEGPWCWEAVAEKDNDFVVGTAYDEDGNALSGQIHSWDENGDEKVIERRTMIGDRVSPRGLSDAEFISSCGTDLDDVLRRCETAVKAAKLVVGAMTTRDPADLVLAIDALEVALTPEPETTEAGE